jgi:hypothetical protein
MKHNVVLTIASLLSILLLTLHITDDIVRGISKAEPSNIALAVLVMLLYGTPVLAERRSGYAIMLLVGLFAAAMPVMHMRGAHYGEIAKSPGGFFFRLDTLGARRARGLHLHPLGARTVDSATGPATVVHHPNMERPVEVLCRLRTDDGQTESQISAVEISTIETRQLHSEPRFGA